MSIRSPFPGMDPWLEQHWGDIHHRLITYACDQLQPNLPKGLRARMQERVFVEHPDGHGRTVYPDVRVVEHGTRHPLAMPAGSSAAVAEPLVVHLPDEEITQGFIEIIDTGGGKVVTVIEILSPSSKQPGEGKNLYLRKQQELQVGRVSLVEIDLLRGGDRVLSIDKFQIPESHRTPYQVCVRRGWRPGEVEVYRVPLREPLPPIRVPLREGDKDVILELQPLVDQAYHNGGYDDLDYKAQPEPPLNPADAAWADEMLKSKALR